MPGVPSAVPDNTRGSVNFDANQAARYYDVTLNNPGTITLDMNPQIDTLSIAGAQSQLVIGGPYTLEVLLDTRLSAGTLTMAGGTLVYVRVPDERRPADGQRHDRGGWRCGQLPGPRGLCDSVRHASPAAPWRRSAR